MSWRRHDVVTNDLRAEVQQMLDTPPCDSEPHAMTAADVYLSSKVHHHYDAIVLSMILGIHLFTRGTAAAMTTTIVTAATFEPPVQNRSAIEAFTTSHGTVVSILNVTFTDHGVAEQQHVPQQQQQQILAHHAVLRVQPAFTSHARQLLQCNVTTTTLEEGSVANSTTFAFSSCTVLLCTTVANDQAEVGCVNHALILFDTMFNMLKGRSTFQPQNTSTVP